MKCLICKGKMEEKLITYDVRTEDQLIVLKNVPALVCKQCGETLFTPETVDKIVAVAKGKVKSRTTLTVPVIEFGKVKVA